ncbi:uncharacterized protein LOC135147920 [Daucus carota subsp. sativus]|uniref:uncharacterized protein LOC135147920 n=1 Tax=Daucus carota subsp. sativus TaxID=79200 RepID=UPI00308311B6
MTKRTRSHLGLPLNPDNPQTDQDNPNQDHTSGPLFTHVNPDENQTVNPNDARVTIEMNQIKYTDVPVTTLHMSQLTSVELAEAIRQYLDRRESNRRLEHIDESEDSGNSRQSRGSVFDRLGEKAKKKKQKESEETRQRILAERKEQIRKEEEEKLEQKIALRVQLEEEKLTKGSRSKRYRKEATPELISDDVDEGPGQTNLRDMINELNRKIGNESGLEIGGTLTPFSHSLESIPRQKGMKHYNFESFNGLGDPEEHLHYFEHIAQIYWYNDLTKCHFFASTFKGGAQRWFSRIPSRSIGSWKDFKEAFLRRFRANKTHELYMCHLETVRQYDNEALSDYMKRFQEAINKISSLDEREALSIFRRNLDPEQNERYVVELINKEPQSLAAAYAMAAKFIKETDVLQAMRMTRQGSSKGKQVEDKPRKEYHQDKKFKPDRQTNFIQHSGSRRTSQPGPGSRSDPGPNRPAREPKPEPEWTPLNRSREDILKEVRDKPFYYAPKPMQTPPESRPANRHCDYHGTHSHKTENCISLKYFIEEQISKGNMGQYIARNTANKGEGSGKQKNIVNVVLGGSCSPPPSPDSCQEVMSIQTFPEQVISFSSKDFEGVTRGHNQALVVTLDITENEVRRILVDNGSSANILFKHTMDRMQLGNIRMNDYREDPLYGFGNSIVPVLGTLYLPVRFGTAPTQVVHMIKFYVTNTPSSYNVIIGRPGLNKIEAITSVTHLKFKFPTPFGVGEVKGDSETAGVCYSQALVMAETHMDNKRKAIVFQKQRSNKKHRLYPRTNPKGEVQVIDLDPGSQNPGATNPGPGQSNQKATMSPAQNFVEKNTDARIQQMISAQELTKVEAAVETESVLIDKDNPTKKVKIGKGLDTVFKEELIQLLRSYADVFAWSPDDMPGLDESLAMHNLDVDPKKKPVKQKRRNFTPERQKAIDEEVGKLIKADIICEIKYPEWLANVVMVKKANGKWRMCVDYTDLNAACPKDPYPLPSIDQLIDATSGHLMLSFMDAFSGYNQVKMNPADIAKTAFITHRAVYAYKLMPFGLRHAGSTYQKAMNEIFKDQLGRNLECYVDDIISKSTSVPGHISDLKECFENMRRTKLKLNPDKCTFGVEDGKFLGFMVSNRGIEANPEKIKAKSVEWSPDCQRALDEIKTYLSKPPILTKALPGEPLYLYLSAGPLAVGAALIREEAGQQKPVYYVSQVLKDAETRYPNLEKFAFALITASRKLRHYFQGREIRIVTNQPLRKIIHKLDISGRLVNWAIELSQFSLTFLPRTAIKAQVLADFVVECNFPENQTTPMETEPEATEDPNPESWTLHVDGSSTAERSGAGLILKSPDGFTIKTAISFGFAATNNQAEYEALLAGLKLVRTLSIRNLTIHNDSQIVARQTKSEYLAKDPILTKYQALVKSYLTLIPGYKILQVNREENAEADNLSRLVHNSADLDSSVYFEGLHKPTIEQEEIFEINNDPTWMTPLINYIEKGELPEDKGKAQRLKAKAAKFFVEGGILFRRTYSAPILKCIGPEESEYCLREVHEGICGDHMSAKSLAYKIIRQGYYWPTIHQDAMEFVKKCKNCQLFSNVPRASPVLPSSVLSPIPFAVWGIDIMGPFPRAKGDLRYLLVSIDHMTKWVEAKAMRTINQQDVIRFMDNILMRFGLPRVLVSDNGPQFIGSDFESYLAERGIKHKKSSVAYPQGNGQVEVTNRILLKGIEKRLEESKNKYPEELPHVL